MINLLVAIYHLIRRETLVLYPAIIFSLITTWFISLVTLDLKNLKIQILFLIASWLINLFIQLLSAEIGLSILKGKTINFSEVVLRSFQRFTPAILATGILACAIAGLFLLSKQVALALFVTIPVIIVGAMFLQIFPVAYVISNVKVFNVYPLLWQLLTVRFRTFIQMFLFIIFITALFIVFSSLTEGLPKPLSAILIPILQGIINVAISYGILLLWELTESRITIKA